MAKARYSKDQIAFALALVDSGMRISKICRQFGVSEAGLYRWRKKFGGKPAVAQSRPTGNRTPVAGEIGAIYKSGGT